MEIVIGYISALIVFMSGTIYSIRVYKKEIEANIVSWVLFSFMGIAIVLTYWASGAKENLLPAIAAIINPILVSIISIFRKNKISFTVIDIICAIIGILSIIFWYNTQDNKYLVQYALYLAIIADIIAMIPTMIFVRKNPNKDRPIPWIMFGFGYSLLFFIIKEHTFANYSLPLWMSFGPALVWIPLVRYRIKNNIPLKEWI